MRTIPDEVTALRSEVEKLKIRIDRALTGAGDVRVITDGSGSVGVFAPHDHQGEGDGGVLTDAQHDGYDDFAEIAAPATPAAGKVRVYAKTDGNVYQKDDAGLETNLASGGGGGAATTEPYVTIGNTAGLSAERALTAGEGIQQVDGGPDGPVTLSAVPLAGAGITVTPAGPNAPVTISAIAATSEIVRSYLPFGSAGINGYSVVL